MVRSAIPPFLLFIGSSVAFAGPLHDAARIGDTGEALALIDGGADVNALDDFGETPLIRSILDRQEGVAILLLERGAKANGRNQGGFTPLHAAAHSGMAEIAVLLLDGGADVNDQENKAGVTALSVASEEGQVAVVKLLIDRGADLEAAEQNGYTPLTRALWRGRRDVVALLQQSGASCQPVEILEEPAFSECMAGQQ